MKDASHSDEQLLASLALQHLPALDALYDRYAKIAFALAYRILGDRNAAEDVVQDAFLSVWRRAKSFDARRGGVKTWLLAIVHHRAIDRLRSAAASPTVLPIDELPDSEDAAVSVWHDVWSNMSGEAVRGALDALPVDQKKSIELAFFSGYSQSEIARLLNVPLGTVKGRMRLGMQKMKSLLEHAELGLTGA